MPTRNIEPNKRLVCNFACQSCWSSPNQNVPWIAACAPQCGSLEAPSPGQETQPPPDGTERSSGSFILAHARRPLCARTMFQKQVRPPPYLEQIVVTDCFCARASPNAFVLLSGLPIFCAATFQNHVREALLPGCLRLLATQ